MVRMKIRNVYKKETLLAERQTGDAIPSDVRMQMYTILLKCQ